MIRKMIKKTKVRERLVKKSIATLGQVSQEMNCLRRTKILTRIVRNPMEAAKLAKDVKNVKLFSKAGKYLMGTEISTVISKGGKEKEKLQKANRYYRRSANRGRGRNYPGRNDYRQQDFDAVFDGQMNRGRGGAGRSTRRPRGDPFHGRPGRGARGRARGSDGSNRYNFINKFSCPFVG